MMALQRVVLCVVVLLCSNACLVCEDEHCDSHLSISFVKSTPWPLGTYQVDLIIDGKPVACSIEVPYGPEGRVDTCDDDATRLVTDTYADAPELTRVSHFGAPDRVELTLLFEREELLVTTVEPEYEDTLNWNRRCGPPCDESSEDVAVP
jgi:hypothetical protein